MIVYLTLEDALRVIFREQIGPIGDLGLLDSALSRPRASAFGEDAYPTLELKAAALLHSLVKNHALVDGNKRLSWLLTMMFLDLNGAEVALGNDAAFDLMIDVATNVSTELKGIAERLSIRAV